MAAKTSKESSRCNVYVRSRPLSENSKENSSILSFPSIKELTIREEKQEITYRFDRVFSSDDDNSKICEEVCQPLIETFLEGCNSCFMVYGQTGSGKTHTILSDNGLVPQTIERVVRIINSDNEYSYCLVFSYLQIYQDKIYDLLVESGGGSLKLREHPKEGIVVEGLSEYQIKTCERAYNLLEQGRKKLVVAETNMVRSSSRSHALCILKVEKSKIEEPQYKSMSNQIEKFTEIAGAAQSLECLKGKLYLCDLAGSERLKKTHVSGKRLVEARYINTSLLELGNVIHALAARNNPHIPFRNSKLTRLLKESLGGNSKASLMICVSPSIKDLKETKCSLNFGQRAMKVIKYSVPNVEVDYKALSKFLSLKLKELESAYRLERENLRELKTKYHTSIPEETASDQSVLDPKELQQLPVLIEEVPDSISENSSSHLLSSSEFLYPESEKLIPQSIDDKNLLSPSQAALASIEIQTDSLFFDSTMDRRDSTMDHRDSGIQTDADDDLSPSSEHISYKNETQDFATNTESAFAESAFENEKSEIGVQTENNFVFNTTTEKPNREKASESSSVSEEIILQDEKKRNEDNNEVFYSDVKINDSQETFEANAAFDIGTTMVDTSSNIYDDSQYVAGKSTQTDFTEGRDKSLEQFKQISFSDKFTETIEDDFLVKIHEKRTISNEVDQIRYNVSESLKDIDNNDSYRKKVNSETQTDSTEITKATLSSIETTKSSSIRTDAINKETSEEDSSKEIKNDVDAPSIDLSSESATDSNKNQMKNNSLLLSSHDINEKKNGDPTISKQSSFSSQESFSSPILLHESLAGVNVQPNSKQLEIKRKSSPEELPVDITEDLENFNNTEFNMNKVSEKEATRNKENSSETKFPPRHQLHKRKSVDESKFQLATRDPIAQLPESVETIVNKTAEGLNLSRHRKSKSLASLELTRDVGKEFFRSSSSPASPQTKGSNQIRLFVQETIRSKTNNIFEKLPMRRKSQENNKPQEKETEFSDFQDTIPKKPVETEVKSKSNEKLEEQSAEAIFQDIQNLLLSPNKRKFSNSEKLSTNENCECSSSKSSGSNLKRRKESLDKQAHNIIKVDFNNNNVCKNFPENTFYPSTSSPYFRKLSDDNNVSKFFPQKCKKEEHLDDSTPRSSESQVPTNEQYFESPMESYFSYIQNEIDEEIGIRPQQATAHATPMSEDLSVGISKREEKDIVEVVPGNVYSEGENIKEASIMRYSFTSLDTSHDGYNSSTDGYMSSLSTGSSYRRCSSADSENEVRMVKNTEKAKKALYKVQKKYEMLLQQFENVMDDKQVVEDELNTSKSCYDLVEKFKSELEAELDKARQQLYILNMVRSQSEESLDKTVSDSEETLAGEEDIFLGLEESLVSVDEQMKKLYKDQITPQHSQTNENSSSPVPKKAAVTSKSQLNQFPSPKKKDIIAHAFPWFPKSYSKLAKEKAKRREKLTIAAIENTEIKKELLLTKLEKNRLEAVLSCIMSETRDQASLSMMRNLTSSRSTVSSSCSNLPLSVSPGAYQPSPMRKYKYKERFLGGDSSTTTTPFASKKDTSTETSLFSLLSPQSSISDFDISSMSDINSPSLLTRMSPYGEAIPEESLDDSESQDMDDLVRDMDSQEERLPAGCLPFLKMKNVRKKLKLKEKYQKRKSSH